MTEPTITPEERAKDIRQWAEGHVTHLSADIFEDYLRGQFREAEQAATDREREGCAATQCRWCRDSVPVELRDVTAEYDDAEGQILFWQHRFQKDSRNSWMDCSAHAIRARKEEVIPKGENK